MFWASIAPCRNLGAHKWRGTKLLLIPYWDQLIWSHSLRTQLGFLDVTCTVKICHFSLVLGHPYFSETHDCHLTITWLSPDYHLTITWLSLSHTTPTHLVDNPRLLQEVLFNHGTLDDTIGRKVNINVLAKTTRVVVPLRLCITKGCRTNDTAMINRFSQSIVNLHTHLPRWDWPPESVVRSRSVGHWQLLETAGSAS